MLTDTKLKHLKAKMNLPFIAALRLIIPHCV